jgi:hypothetical protein
MRHVWAVVSCLAVVSLATVVVAQDKPLAEVTGAYQFNYLTASADGESASTNVPVGFDASVNVPITRWFGAVGDIGRVWKTESASVGTVQASAIAENRVIRTVGPCAGYFSPLFARRTALVVRWNARSMASA